MTLKVLNPRHRKSSFFRYKQTRSFRDDLIVIGKKKSSTGFLTGFNNPYITYEIITKPLSNGTYKIQVLAEDSLGNRSSVIEESVALQFYPLPPVDIAAFYGDTMAGATQFDFLDFEPLDLIFNESLEQDIILTWSHSSEGAPDFYRIYGNRGSGFRIDDSFLVAQVAGTETSVSFTITGSGLWLFVVQAVNGSLESISRDVVSIMVPVDDTKPGSPGVPAGELGQTGISGISLSRVSVGKVKIRFLWLGGDEADYFEVFHDNGRRDPYNFASFNFRFARQNGIVQEYTTTQLFSAQEVRRYGFIIKAENSYGNIDENTQIYYIDVDGQAPDVPGSLTLDTVF